VKQKKGGMNAARESRVEPMMQNYDKLVRDNIPDMIISQGKIPVTRALSGQEYKEYLNKKLKEEVEEYLTNNSVEELCDIAEVIVAIAASMDIPQEEFETERLAKRMSHGGFNRKILLEKVLTK
jgi:predicted house-cleaning noncanonical NTP pyrophosphatase (MazG superfamily)